ncbi:MAG: hsp70 family protein [Nitrospirae bacterium]|nr:hsp70 family protein [Nitrospirota bacterium]
MSRNRYIIGIDLGTTNSSVAYVDTKEGEQIHTLEILQLVDEGQVKGLPQLPSFLYLPTEYERSSEDYALPWAKDMSYIVGGYARVKGAKSALNLVSSAKSWLCHSRIGRTSPILPWGREDPAGKLSPVEASCRYLRHIADAWDYVVARGDAKQKLVHQDIVITIPASFDESARELTSEAAKMAGIQAFTMLEEPQAAFYSWLSSHEHDWQDFIELNRLILVFDIGGGTTDFNLIRLRESGAVPVFQRMAVGDHLMLGGDNMDLALAMEMETRILGARRTLGLQGWVSLSGQCRAAKEELLSGSHAREAFDISILGAGRSVIGGAVKGQITYDDVRRTIIDGFFQRVDKADPVTKDKRSGLQELGLPYVTDTAVMRHLSSFLKRHAITPGVANPVNSELPVVSDGGVDIVRPDMILFNGGVFKPALIRQCAADGLRDWFISSNGQTDWTLKILENESLEHAVSLGAAYYGLVKRHAASDTATKKIKISGGLGKAYYIAVKTSADDGQQTGGLISAACIVPRGFEEGGELHIREPEFSVAANTPVAFSVYCSSYRAGDRPGDIITAEGDSFVELPQIKTILNYGKKGAAAVLPVSLGIRLNEYGTLDVWCESKHTTHKWRLAFDVRSSDGQQAARPLGDLNTLSESNIDDAVRLIDAVFTGQSPETPDNLPRALSGALGIDNKSNWPLSAIRKMWDALIQHRQRRLVTPRHEARWLNLAGFLLRPGFGHPLDDWRVRELWKIFSEGVRFSSDGQCRLEWWILWRRVAGGLSEVHQDIIYKRAMPLIISSKKKVRRIQGAEFVELWMLVSSLERLSAQLKTALGDELVNIIKKEKGRTLGSHYWSLSRIGARMSFYGPLDKLAPVEAVTRWIKECLKLTWTSPEDAAYAIAQLARKTGDRTRDIDEPLRAEIIKRLSPYAEGDAPANRWACRYIRQIEELTPLDNADENEIFGESLPIGLIVDEQSRPIPTGISE